MSREEMLSVANETLAGFQNHPTHKAQIFFKGTCPKCKNRVSCVEANTLYENLECCECGTVFPFEQGGMDLHLEAVPFHKEN